jgi:hypothetical protein
MDFWLKGEIQWNGKTQSVANLRVYNETAWATSTSVISQIFNFLSSMALQPFVGP